jgi:DNA modification methylase
MRPRLTADVWLGPPDCYRNQDAVLLPIAEATQTDKRLNRHDLDKRISGTHVRHDRMHNVCTERGGSTPYNVKVLANSDGINGSAAHGHVAGTPERLCDWWVRYICPEGGTVLDPFSGAGTVGVAAVKQYCSYIGIERIAKYHEAATERIARAVPRQLRLELGG